jgi:hypothetical protein
VPIRVRFSVEYESRIKCAEVRKPMTDWSSKMAEHLKTQRSTKEQSESVFLERQRLIKNNGPALWDQVIADVQSNCDDLNREMGEQVAAIDTTPHRWINVNGRTPNGVRKLAADFDPDAALLKWVAGANSGKYEVSVGSDGKAAFYRLDDRGERLFVGSTTPKEIADEMLNALFAGLFS